MPKPRRRPRENLIPLAPDGRPIAADLPADAAKNRTKGDMSRFTATGAGLVIRHPRPIEKDRRKKP